MESDVGDPEAALAARKRDEVQLAQLLHTIRCPFGPPFFVEQLSAFLRDRCPDPGEQLPRVDIWHVGEPLAVCHIVAVAPSWVAVAVRDRHAHNAEMRTELIPYETISRVTIGAPVARSRGIGFDCAHRPEIVEDAQPPSRVFALAAEPARADAAAPSTDFAQSGTSPATAASDGDVCT